MEMEIEISMEDMVMGKRPKKSEQVTVGETAAKKLGALDMMQSKMDKMSMEMLKQFDRNELRAMKEKHDMLADTHRRAVTMLSDRLRNIPESEDD